jgi:hypothetical protein
MRKRVALAPVNHPPIDELENVYDHQPYEAVNPNANHGKA